MNALNDITLEPACSSTGDPWERLTLLAAAVGVFSYLICEIYSLDVWWQITIGHDILRTIHIPTLDRYTAAGLGLPYHDSHWLFQVLLAGWHWTFGMVGVQLFIMFLWGAILTLVYRSCRAWVSVSSAAALTFLTAMASSERFLPRPELFTFFGIAGMYFLLQRKAYRRRAGLVAIAVLQIVWANTHGLFVIGPFMVGCYWAAACKKKLKGDDSDIKLISKGLATTVVATLVSPFPIEGWKYAFLLVAEVGQKKAAVFGSLGELSPTFGHAARSAPAFWFFLILLATCVGSVVQLTRQKRFSPRLLILLGLTAAAMTGRRNTVLFAIVAAPILAETMASFPSFSVRFRRASIVVTAVFMFGWAWYPVSGNYYVKMEVPARFGLGATPSFFPHDLPHFLDSIGFSGNILNSNTLGGFCSFHGFPERLPLTDGRWEIHDPAVLDSIIERSRQSNSWRELVFEYEVQGIMLAHTSPEAKALVPDLHRARDWRLVYFDAAASFWIKRETLPGLPSLETSDHSHLPKLRRPDDGLILGVFLALLGDSYLQIENFKRTLAFGVKRSFVLEKLGAAQIDVRDYPGAETTFLALLELDPENTAALNELAFLSYQAGDLDRAETLMVQVVKLEPNNNEYRENYERIRSAKANRPTVRQFGNDQ